jgi:Domain of unknown function (DUF6378)
MTISKTDAVLAERGKRYGDFKTHAEISQTFKEYFHGRAADLDQVEKEAADMVFHKLGRILNGDPWYDDSWQDIAGYAKLVLTPEFLKLKNPREWLVLQGREHGLNLQGLFFTMPVYRKAVLPPELENAVIEILNLMSAIGSRPHHQKVSVQYFWFKLVKLAEGVTDYVRVMQQEEPK